MSNNYDADIDIDIYFEDKAIYVTCAVCGERFAEHETELEYGVCEYCYNENYTFENALDYMEHSEDKRDVEVDGFYAFAFTENEINDILKIAFEQKTKVAPDVAEQQVIDYCNEDKLCFADYLERTSK